MPHVLIVDDDQHSNSILHELMVAEGYSVIITENLKQVQIQIALQKPDLVICNLNLKDDYEFYFFQILEKKEKIKIIFMEETPSLDKAINVFRHGATDYFAKPIDTAYIQSLLKNWSIKNNQHIEKIFSEKKIKDVKDFSFMLGESPAMKNIFHQIERVAPTEVPVLILGESGTGKELVAQKIHAKSGRHKQPFFPINCGAISPQLIESEIFGHEKGSFTGAERQHKGYFERASGGTLFLDEVVEMPIELQVKLLRVLEAGSFMRIGSNQEIQTNVRIIAATNRHPETAINDGKLRLDLYHRLNVFPIKIPSLRERGQDIELLAKKFLDEFNSENSTKKYFSKNLFNKLCDHPWPGNVRELRNYIQRAYILADDLIDANLVAPENFYGSIDDTLTLTIPVGTSLADVDRKLIFATLELCDGVKKRAADVLGISLKTLYNRLEEYGVREKIRSRTEVNARLGSVSNISGGLLN